jgi:hypothetical protein
LITPTFCMSAYTLVGPTKRYPCDFSCFANASACDVEVGTEDAARELPNLSLEDALQLVHLYGERSSPKFEPAARRWPVRYLTEGTPSMPDVARVTASLAGGAD